MRRRRTKKRARVERTRPGDASREVALTRIGHRFKDLRVAKQFARESLERGYSPPEILARVHEICRNHYTFMEEGQRELMIDLVLSAVSGTIADWLATPDPSLARISAWIDQTVASNQAHVHMDVIEAGRTSRA